ASGATPEWATGSLSSRVSAIRESLPSVVGRDADGGVVEVVIMPSSRASSSRMRYSTVSASGVGTGCITLESSSKSSNSMSGGNTRVPMPNIPKSPASVVSWGEERSASGGSCRWVRWLDGGDSSGSAQTSTPVDQSGGGAVWGCVAAAGVDGALPGG